MVILTNKWHYIATLNKYFCQTTFQCNNSSWLIHQFVYISQLRALLVFVFSVMMNDIVNWYNIVSIKQLVMPVYQRWCRFCKNTKKNPNPLMSNKQNIKITQFNRNPFFFTVQTFPKRKKNQIIGLRGSVYIKIPFNVSLISQKENGTIWNQNPVTDITTFHCITSQDLNCHRDRVWELTCKLQIKHICAYFLCKLHALRPHKRGANHFFVTYDFFSSEQSASVAVPVLYDKQNAERRQMEA